MAASESLVIWRASTADYQHRYAPRTKALSRSLSGCAPV